MFNNQPFDLGYGDWLNHAAIQQQQQLTANGQNLSNGSNNASNGQNLSGNNSQNIQNQQNQNNLVNALNNQNGMNNNNSNGQNTIQNTSQNQNGQINNNQMGQNSTPRNTTLSTQPGLGPYQHPYMMQNALNQMQQRASQNGLPGMSPMLAYDPNTNPYQISPNNHPLQPNIQPELNTIQQMQMLILQEQQTLDATLKDENPNDRFKRYQAAYAKILQHQSSYGQQAQNLQAQIAQQQNNNQYLTGPNPSALINPLLSNMYNNGAGLPTPNPMAINQNMFNMNNISNPQLELLNQMAQQQQKINNSQQQQQQQQQNTISQNSNSQPQQRQTLTTNDMDTTSPIPQQITQPSPTPEDNSLQVNSMNKNITSSGKSNGTENSSVTGDSALGRSSTSGSVNPNDPDSLRQSMTNSRAQQNRIKEGVVASAAQLTPGLFSNADNIQEFLGLAENPQIHVPCTAKCYHKCKLGISCPRHAHKHHERKIRKQKQAAAAAAAAAAANGEEVAADGTTPATKDKDSVVGSCKGNKSQETSSSMSVCSDTFNNLDKKSGKDGKKRTFLDLYEVYNVIGVGGGGMVYSGRRIQDKLPVAIKRVMREKVKRWETVQGYQVPQEIALMLRCYGHPGIIKLVDWYECLDSFILIMERPERAVDLFDYIREIGRVTEKEAARIFKQILDAAMHIQNCGVVHRDIKDENIIINRDTMEAKLIDFGCGTLLKDGPYRDFSGTPEFYPPEWFVDREYYARTACVWSLGVLLFDMTQGEIPFKQKEKIVENKPTYKHPISESCQNLIKWCMNTNQNSRPTLEQIQCHMWVMLNCLPSYGAAHAAQNLAQNNPLVQGLTPNQLNNSSMATLANHQLNARVGQQNNSLLTAQLAQNNGQISNNGLNTLSQLSSLTNPHMNNNGLNPAGLLSAQLTGNPMNQLNFAGAMANMAANNGASGLNPNNLIPNVSQHNAMGLQHQLAQQMQMASMTNPMAMTHAGHANIINTNLQNHLQQQQQNLAHQQHQIQNSMNSNDSNNILSNNKTQEGSSQENIEDHNSADSTKNKD